MNIGDKLPNGSITVLTGLMVLNMEKFLQDVVPVVQSIPPDVIHKDYLIEEQFAYTLTVWPNKESLDAFKKGPHANAAKNVSDYGIPFPSIRWKKDFLPGWDEVKKEWSK